MKVNGKQSVATMWAEMVKAAENGEVVAVANKHGKDVAVMLGIEQYTDMMWEMLCRANLDMLLDRPTMYRSGMTWDQVVFDE